MKAKRITALVTAVLLILSLNVGVFANENAITATRGMAVTALWKMENCPQVNLIMPFKDVSQEDYYAEAVRWAAAEKIVSGTSETEFSADDAITREQIAALAKRYAKYKDAYTDCDADVSAYTDFETETSDYAKDSIKFCVAEGIINEKTETGLAPADNVTMSEITAIMAKLGEIVAKTDDIVIIYTHDTHCNIYADKSYSTVSALKKKAEHSAKYVTLVDSGDAIQGDIVGTLSNGECIVDIMNKAGYDYKAFGNHEFAYGIEVLSNLIDKTSGEYVCCNLEYSGNKEDITKKYKPYSIKEYGDKKIAFIGVATPDSIASSTPGNFKEDDKFVYSFSSESAEKFYACIQKNVDECKEQGADIVILLAHLGDDELDIPFTSTDVVENTKNVDIVLDAHDHRVLEGGYKKNKEGKDVLVTATGSRFQHIGKLTITENGEFKTSFMDEYKGFDPVVKAAEDETIQKCDELLGGIVGVSDKEYSILDDEGIRMVRTRGLTIGNFCADAFKTVYGADIGLVNGGGIRESIKPGDIKKKDILNIFPFNNEGCVIKLKGDKLADALEFSVKNISNLYKKDGKTCGEFGGFLQVAGVKFEVDTSVKSPVITDEAGMCIGFNGERRVKNIEVADKNGVYHPLDVNAEYVVASTNYLLLKNGDGQTAFDNAEVLVSGGKQDFDVLLEYLTDCLNGDMSNYKGTEERITVKTN